MSDPLKPSADVLVRLGSALVHAEEATSSSADPVDQFEFEQLMKDPILVEWIKGMNDLAMLPVKR